MHSSSKKTLRICLCGIFSALIAIGAYIRIPIPVVPFTMQVLFTTLAGLLLGAKYGSISVIIYVMIGLIGVPVFTEGGGIYYVLKPSFGYLIGFIFGTYLTGKIANADKNPSLKRLITANFAGLSVVYIMGMAYCYLAKNFWIAGEGIDFKTLFKYCFLMIIPGDALTCVFAAFLGKRLIPLTEKYRD